ncbi:hypothetical protein J6590_060426 [Homalodisca vitripennis]|nr:hypothetical protein J6590_060426 [Homalodisca vitripennis]
MEVPAGAEVELEVPSTTESCDWHTEQALVSGYAYERILHRNGRCLISSTYFPKKPKRMAPRLYTVMDDTTILSGGRCEGECECNVPPTYGIVLNKIGSGYGKVPGTSRMPYRHIPAEDAAPCMCSDEHEARGFLISLSS